MTMLHRILFTLLFFFTTINVNSTIYGCFSGMVHEGLYCPEKDVTALAHLYRENLKDSIKAERGGVYLIRGTGVNKHNVLHYFKLQALACTEDDMLVFADSGHGNKDGIYCGTEFITWSEIINIFNMSKARVKVMFIGTCHSGGVTNFLNEIRLQNGAHFFGLASSRENELSYEEVGAKLSFFFRRLVMGLRGDADSDNNGSVTMHELSTYIHNKIALDTDFLGSKREHPMSFGRYNGNVELMSWK